MCRCSARYVVAFVFCGTSFLLARLTAKEIPIADVDGQPLVANIQRLTDAFQYLGHSLGYQDSAEFRRAVQSKDSRQLQRLLDQHALLVVHINPESRVKVQRGPAPAQLHQGGFTPFLVKVLNESTVTKRLRILSPQSGARYAGVATFSLGRQQQQSLASEDKAVAADRFLQVEMFDSPPMLESLSGLEVEYRIALFYSRDAGKREALIQFDVAQGNQDLGFRGEVPVLFEIRPAIAVPFSIRDHDGRPTTARLEIRDERGRVYPPQVKRLAPDLFFQPQIYRHDGETVQLSKGRYVVKYSRGPEYLVETRSDERRVGKECRSRWSPYH